MNRWYIDFGKNYHFFGSNTLAPLRKQGGRYCGAWFWACFMTIQPSLTRQLGQARLI